VYDKQRKKELLIFTGIKGNNRVFEIWSRSVVELRRRKNLLRCALGEENDVRNDTLRSCYVRQRGRRGKKREVPFHFLSSQAEEISHKPIQELVSDSSARFFQKYSCLTSLLLLDSSSPYATPPNHYAPLQISICSFCRGA